MREWPKTIEEANSRIVAYYNKLMFEGHSHSSAYRTAMASYRKHLLSHFAPREGQVIDTCDYCHGPIIHGELYGVTADDSGVTAYHSICEENNRIISVYLG